MIIKQTLLQDPRDAEDAVKGLDGTELCGMIAHVEMAKVVFLFLFWRCGDGQGCFYLLFLISLVQYGTGEGGEEEGGPAEAVEGGDAEEEEEDGGREEKRKEKK